MKELQQRVDNLLSERLAETRRFCPPYDKIVASSVAVTRVAEWQAQGQRVVMMDAVLDLPTATHAEAFIAHANLGDKLLVRVNSDEFVASRKDRRGPIVPWEERVKHASHYPYVDLITKKEVGGWEYLSEYKPDVVVKSTSSGKAVLAEIMQLIPLLEGLPTKLVVTDEYGEMVPFDEVYGRAMAFEEQKMEHTRLSGSLIKQEIIRRAEEDKRARIEQTIFSSSTVRTIL